MTDSQQFGSNWFDGPRKHVHTCMYVHFYMHTHLHPYRHICTGGELLFVWFAGFAPAATTNSIIEVKFRHPPYPLADNG